MTHKMQLNDSPFYSIWNNKKTIELRLFDDKRRSVSIDDTIVFSNRNEADKMISVKVIALHVFDSFETLYKTLPLEKCGYSKDALPKANAEDMNQYYSIEEQKKYGVVGIEFELISKT